MNGKLTDKKRNKVTKDNLDFFDDIHKIINNTKSGVTAKNLIRPGA